MAPMAFAKPAHLPVEKLRSLLACFPPDADVAVVRIRPHDKGEIRRSGSLKQAELEAMLLEAHEQGHLGGGDLEVAIPGLDQQLVCHHDGVFWLEPIAKKHGS